MLEENEENEGSETEATDLENVEQNTPTEEQDTVATFASPFGEVEESADAQSPSRPAYENLSGQASEESQVAATAQTPPYVQQPYTPPYTNQQYGQPAYGSQSYDQPYTQAPPWQGMDTPQGQGYGPGPGQNQGPSPYGQFAQAQFEPQPEKEKQKKEKPQKSDKSGGPGIGRGNMIVLVIIIVIACVASGIGGGLIGANLNQNSPITIDSSGNPSITIEPRDDITTTEAVAKKVLSSVVGIESTTTVMSGGGFFGQRDQEVTGVGTGMIIDANGYILTNSHVVMDGAIANISVHLSNGEQTAAELIWNDAGLDLAIVKVDVKGLSPVEFGDSNEVAIGSFVVAIGNPLGLAFSGSVTQGVVSGLDRTITVSGGMNGAISTMQDLIQVDAAINSGNSGGPLLNSKGQVIGVNTAKAQAEGMGFAIPINTALPIVEKVLKEGSFERVFMGVSAADVRVIRENYPNVEIKADFGAVITDVNPGSPAEKAGLKVKDVITSVNGSEIIGSDSLIKMLLGYSSGDKITIVYNRDGEINETEVTLMSQSELESVQQEENPFKDPRQGNIGR